MRFLFVIAIILAVISCGKQDEPFATQAKLFPEKGAESQYQREMEEIKKSIRGDLKIKLKKDAKGGYSWEITGKDVNEVTSANEVLRKKLSE